MKNLHLFNLLLLTLFILVRCEKDNELFTSTREIEELYEKEIQLVQDVKSYVKELEEQITSINSALKTIVPDVEKRIHPNNPISAALVLKRCSINWIQLRNALNTSKIASKEANLLEELNHFPNSDELTGAMNGIFLLQETYDLDPLEFSKGVIQNKFMDPIKEDIKLSIYDMEYLGKLAYNRGFIDRAADWVSAAIDRNKKESDDSSFYTRLNKTLDIVHRHHDEYLEKRGSPRGPNWKTYVTPFNHQLAKKKKYKKALKNNGGDRRYRMIPVLGKHLSPHEKWEQFNRLCRGENIRPPSEEKKLKSFYLHHNDPYLRLGPFKVEVNNVEPSVVVFKDFIYPEEGEAFIRFAEDKLERSFAISKEGQSRNVITRTSKQAWLKDDVQASNLITKRVELATGFDAKYLSGNEPYQIANYGLGGVYNSHMDSGGTIMTEYEELGDRVATIMAYISDVKAGGGTAFPDLGIKVTPEKGAAVFWYNVDKNGVQDYRMFHGGCPVLCGSKWITNKWIRAWANWKTHPCATESDDNMRTFHPPSNKPEQHYWNYVL